MPGQRLGAEGSPDHAGDEPRLSKKLFCSQHYHRGVCGMPIGINDKPPRRPPQKQGMKKPSLRIEVQQPRNIQRADIAPGDGYAMVVDGHFKTQFSEESAAKKAATELLSRYPMLQVESYDARAKIRTRVEQGKELHPAAS